MSESFEEYEMDIVFEIKLVSVIVFFLALWVISLYFTNFRIFDIPTSVVTGLLLVFMGVWLGFNIKKRRKKKKERDTVKEEYLDAHYKDKEEMAIDEEQKQREDEVVWV